MASKQTTKKAKAVRKKPGPSGLSPARRAAIIESIEAGNYIAVSAQANGVPERTFYEWLEKGRNGRAGYTSFLRDVEEAQRKAEDRLVTIVSNAALDQWQAAAWLLERKNYKRWGRKDKLEAEVNIKTDMSSLTDEQLEQLAAGDFAAIAGQSGVGASSKG